MTRKRFISWHSIRVIAMITALAACLAARQSPSAEKTAAIEAPDVTKVVLYKHGMGYIERQGKVRDAAVLQLTFRADQMKDLLTSFYAVDLSGGHIASVQYETKDPLNRQLQDILIQVPENAALSQFLTRLQGARLTVKASGETIAGRILGTEPTSEIVSGQTVRQSLRLVILTDAGPVRSVDLFGITELTLADENLRRDLNRLLDLTLESKYTNRKRLVVTAAGQGEREVRLGYMLEMPIWKASYRLILNAKEKDSAILQGWAQAENTTEEDWKDVALSFVAGNPFSYIMDLYAPLYVRRPIVPVPGLQDLEVDWAQSASPEISSLNAPMPPPAPRAMGGVRKDVQPFANVAQIADAAARSAAAPSFGNEALVSSVESAAQGAKVGELFSYTPKEKVTILRGQAALIPIVSKPLQGKRVVYYKAAFSPKPTDAWVLRNDTDVTLEAGAVTFFEGSTSLGEGILAHTLPPGSQEVLPYAADASVDVSSHTEANQQPYFRGKLADGILTVARVELLTTTWKLTNRGKEAAALWLNQPKNAMYTLSKPEKPLKEVNNHYRFEVPLKPGETRDFVVEEKREVQETVDVGHVDPTRLRFFASERYLSAGTRALLTDLGDLMSRKASLLRQVKEWQDQTQRLSDEEERLRRNVNTTSVNSPNERDLRAKWMSALSAAEEKLAGLRGQIDQASGQIRQIEEELARKIREYRGD